MRHLLHNPMLVWFVLLAMLVTMFSWPPRGWRQITIAVCLIIVAIVVILHTIA